MFGWWKPQPAVKILAGIVDRLDNTADHRKLSYVRKNLAHMMAAMHDDPIHAAHYYNHAIYDTEGTADKYERALGYLSWHAEIFATLHDDESVVFNSDHLSPAAQYFFDHTKDDAIAAFDQIFPFNPHLAIAHLAPAKLFKDQISDAMHILAQHDNPHLYFDCYDEIYDGLDQADMTPLTQQLTDATVKALENLLQKDAASLLFPSTGNARKPRERSHYLHYLPDGPIRERFVSEHAATIDAAFDNLGEQVTDAHLRDKKIILAERVKICFRAAASGDASLLNDITASLERDQSPYVFIYTHYPDMPYLLKDHNVLAAEQIYDDMFMPLFDMIRMTNPSAAEEAIDQDHGGQSKYLWMIRRDDTVLAASFSKAAMRNYLEHKQRGTGIWPTLSDWDDFLYEPPEKKAETTIDMAP